MAPFGDSDRIHPKGGFSVTSIPATRKATLSISIPADQQEAFYMALAYLKHRDGGLFTSVSSLIVQAVIDAPTRQPGAEADDSPIEFTQYFAQAKDRTHV
jgi:hypothetical protein